MPPLATRMEEEPVGLKGRAQVHLLEEWLSIFGQAVGSTWESVMSSYQSEERKDTDQKTCYSAQQ